MIFLSATPLPLWFYIVWAISILVWLSNIAFRINSALRYLKAFNLVVSSLCIAGLLMELPFYLKPSFPKSNYEKLYVIGDSVSAGIGGTKEETWPKILHKKYGINVVNLSKSGATVASAIRQAAQIKTENAMVFLEIGGNDLFAPTPAKTFEESLKQILKKVSSPTRLVVMLELPLMPWDIKYGNIQRRLAKQFNVILIPKRFFVSVLAAKNATLDLAHLSQNGHQLMAEKIWSLIKPSILSTVKPNENQDSN